MTSTLQVSGRQSNDGSEWSVKSRREAKKPAPRLWEMKPLVSLGQSV